MADFYTSCLVSLIVFLACYHLIRADIAAVQNNTQATRLLLQDQVGENLFASYRSALVNRLNQTTFQNGNFSISAQCFADLMKIKFNANELFKCKCDGLSDSCVNYKM